MVDEAAKLKLVGVRPYANAWLEERGFYVGQKGQLYGNEGTIQVVTKNGINYHLFFGEIALGDKDDKAAKKAVQQGSAAAPNRYMAVFVQYRADADSTLPKPVFSDPNVPAGSPTNAKEISAAVEAGKAKSAKAQVRFGGFFYVISDASFKKLRPGKAALFDQAAGSDPKAPAKTPPPTK